MKRLYLKMESQPVNNPQSLGKTAISNLVKGLPLLTLFFIGVVFGKQTYYYYIFKVPIKYFLGLSEIGSYLANDVIFMIILSISLSVLFYGLFLLLPKMFLKRKAGSIYGLYILLFTIITLQPLLKGNGLAIYSHGILLETILVGGMMLHFIIHPIITKYIAELYFKLLIATGWIICIYIFIWTGVEIMNIKSGKYTGSYIKTVDSTYTSNDTTYFIGKTEKYVFIYESKKNGTRIIPTDKIEEMFITTK